MKLFLAILLFSVSVSAATYYVNPLTGNDSNDGLTPAAAWQTAGKINSFAFSSGDILAIDTTGAMLDLSATNLIFDTSGLTVKATNAPYWTNKLWQTLTNAHFSGVDLPANCYSIPVFNPTPFGQSNIVVWEDDKWMRHPTGVTWASVSNSVATNAGSFWTDGTTIYVHPFGDTSPSSDGKVYTRSVARDSTGGATAISLNASNLVIQDIHAGKTGMARSSDNDAIGAYVLGTLGAFVGTNSVSHCYLYYGAKHIVGFTTDADNSYLTVTDVQAEQCVPYGSSSAFVSFMGGATKSNNVHRYIRCRTDWPIGGIGSTSGALTVQSVMLMHNNGPGLQFQEVLMDGCYINGYVALTICSNATIINSTIGGFQPNAVLSNVCERTKFIGTGMDLQFNGAAHTVIRNCIAIHTNQLTGGQWSGWQLSGSNVVIENCTIDMRGSVPLFPVQNTGIMKRNNQVNLTFRNNIVLMGTNQYSVFQNFTTNDTYSISNNIYQLASSGWVSAMYTNGASGADRTFAQWQALGFDVNSLNTDPFLAATYYAPMRNSVAINAGVNIGSQTDFTGTLFNPRNDIGAVESGNASTYLSGRLGISGRTEFK